MRVFVFADHHSHHVELETTARLCCLPHGLGRYTLGVTDVTGSDSGNLSGGSA